MNTTKASPNAQFKPTRLDANLDLPDGTVAHIRPIRPEDEPLMIRFHQVLSEQTVYLRYFYYFGLDRRIRHERLLGTCSFNGDSDMAFVAERAHGEEREIIGVGRLSRSASKPEAEISLLVSDSHQGHRVGTALFSRLVSFARELRLDQLTASVLFENYPMRKILKTAGFKFDPNVTSEVLEARLILEQAPRSGDFTQQSKAA